MKFLMNIHSQENVAQIECSALIPLICAYKDQVKYYPNAVFMIIETDFVNRFEDPLIFDSRYDTVKRVKSGYRINRGNRPSKEEEDEKEN